MGLRSLVGGLRGGDIVSVDGAELKLGTSDTLIDPDAFLSYMYDLPDDERCGELGETVVLDMTDLTDRDRARLCRELVLGDTVEGDRTPEGLGGLETT